MSDKKKYLGIEGATAIVNRINETISFIVTSSTTKKDAYTIESVRMQGEVQAIDLTERHSGSGSLSLIEKIFQRYAQKKCTIYIEYEEFKLPVGYFMVTTSSTTIATSFMDNFDSGPMAIQVFCTSVQGAWIQSITLKTNIEIDGDSTGQVVISEKAISTDNIADKAITKEKLADGIAPIIIELTEADNELQQDIINNFGKATIDSMFPYGNISYYYNKDITSDKLKEYYNAYTNGTLIFIKLSDGGLDVMMPVQEMTKDGIFISFSEFFLLEFNFCGTASIIDNKLVCVLGVPYSSREKYTIPKIGINDIPIKFNTSSGSTTVTVPTNERVYYYDDDTASSSTRYPKYSMGVHGNITFNLDFDGSIVQQYHIEFRQYSSGKTIRFPEWIDFKELNPDTNNNITINRDTENYTCIKTNSEDTYITIDITSTYDRYTGIITAVPITTGLYTKYSKIKFEFSNQGSYADITPSSGTISDDGILYTSTAGKFTYTYKGTSYDPNVTIDQYNPINETITI